MNMSFQLTTRQIYARLKNVTRRLGWARLKPGQVLWAIEKGQGLKKGETVKRLCRIKVKSVRRERLNRITKSDCVREGFPEMTPKQFVKMFCATHKHCTPETMVRRIEFSYL